MCNDDVDPESTQLNELKQPNNTQTHYLTHDQVPFEFREYYITKGYRLINQPVSYYIRSVFYLNNETFNIWSHFIPFVFTILHLFYSILFNINTITVLHAPLFVYQLTIALYLIGSTIAHVFDSMSPTVRHMCFILDYLGISIYGMGSAIAYEAYSIIEPEHSPMKCFFLYYLWMASIFTSLLNIATCYSRFIVRKSPRVLVRMGSFILQYTFVHIPLLYRFGIKFWNGYHQTDLGVFNRADLYYLIQFIFAFMSAFLYAGHVPERLSKSSRFDLIGQSHQFFHLTAVACTWFQYHAVTLDMKTNLRAKNNPGLESCSVILLSIFLNCLIIVAFYFKVRNSKPLIQEK